MHDGAMSSTAAPLRIYRNIAELLDQSNFFAGGRDWCIASLMALDFETSHFLDRIAHHHLLGCDCFIFFMDHNRSSSSASVAALQRLAWQPRLIALVSGSISSQNDVSATLRKLLRRRPVEFFSHLDGDEWMVPHLSAAADAPDRQLSTIIPFLRATLTRDRKDAIYLHSWTFGSARHATLSAQQLADPSNAGMQASHQARGENAEVEG